MDLKTLLSLFKFYKGESVNPFIKRDKMSAMWWEGEKTLYQNVSDNPLMWAEIRKELDEAIAANHVAKYLKDESNPIKKRIIVFYLDLWHGKYYPYNQLDEIFDYVKA